ncbi:MAG: hypothetical protein Kow0049_34930 [Stanieria sp.]
MILVTVSTEKFPFNRLMQWIDNLIAEGVIPSTEEVVVKYGSCLFIAGQDDDYALLPEIKISNLISNARLIISDCGEGTLNLLAKVTKPFILILDNYNKYIDQNRILAEQLAQKDIPTARNQKELAQFLTAYNQ